MDKLIEQALKKHKIVRYLDTFEKVMLTYKTLLEAEMEAKNISSNPMLADSAVFSKEQVIRIVAEFGRTYNTEAFLGNGETLEQAIEEVKDLIKWDA